ncbi:MAG: hypothetical protein KHX13_04765 [Acidaminococcus intestini]|uniref:Uncharacterized protein n=1 Tax=Acidaminococcus intestini TaxID=187327 RepID=A0A943EGW7_9FIRM|nr:hypothetical protein [Acidaminococcus intestini]
MYLNYLIDLLEACDAWDEVPEWVYEEVEIQTGVPIMEDCHGDAWLEQVMEVVKGGNH